MVYTLRTMQQTGETYRSKKVMPRPSLAEIREYLDRVDETHQREEADPLAWGWQHMQESRGWK